MIAKKNRLTKSRIEHILKKGHAFRSRFFIGRYFENTEQLSRYCVIISRKISTKAVIRNLLRRQIYESIRLNKEHAQNLDMILIPKKSALNTDFKGIQKDIITILDKKWTN